MYVFDELLYSLPLVTIPVGDDFDAFRQFVNQHRSGTRT